MRNKNKDIAPPAASPLPISYADCTDSELHMLANPEMWNRLRPADVSEYLNKFSSVLGGDGYLELIFNVCADLLLTRDDGYSLVKPAMEILRDRIQGRGQRLSTSSYGKVMPVNNALDEFSDASESDVLNPLWRAEVVERMVAKGIKNEERIMKWAEHSIKRLKEQQDNIKKFKQSVSQVQNSSASGLDIL